MGGYIRDVRTDRGMSQKELAELAKVSKGYLSTLESNKIGLPAPDVRRRLATALGVSHLDLLVAAGEITRDELGTAVGVVMINPTDSKARLHAAIDTIPISDDRIEGMIAMLQTWNELARRRPR